MVSTTNPFAVEFPIQHTRTMTHRGEHKDKINPVTTTSATSGNMSKMSRTVLLQTARAVAYNEENNRSMPVRVLFDNGSQRSYITDNVCSKVGLAIMCLKLEWNYTHVWETNDQHGQQQPHPSRQHK